MENSALPKWAESLETRIPEFQRGTALVFGGALIVSVILNILSDGKNGVYLCLSAICLIGFVASSRGKGLLGKELHRRLLKEMARADSYSRKWSAEDLLTLRGIAESLAANTHGRHRELEHQLAYFRELTNEAELRRGELFGTRRTLLLAELHAICDHPRKIDGLEEEFWSLINESLDSVDCLKDAHKISPELCGIFERSSYRVAARATKEALLQPKECAHDAWRIIWSQNWQNLKPIFLASIKASVAFRLERNEKDAIERRIQEGTSGDGLVASFELAKKRLVLKELEAQTAERELRDYSVSI